MRLALLFGATLLLGCAKRVVVNPPAPVPSPVVTSLLCEGDSPWDCFCYQPQADGTRLLVPCIAVPQ